MKKMMQWLVPKEKVLLELLAEQSESVFEASKNLKDFVNEYSKLERSERKSRSQSIKMIGQRVDGLTHNIIRKLRKSFAAPIGKEDLYKIASLMEDISGLINSAASRFVIFSIEHLDEDIIKMADITNAIVDETNKSVKKLKQLKKIKEDCNKVYELWAEACEIYEKSLADLFHYHKSAVDIIKYKDIYELLKSITGKCKSVANVIDGVIARHA